MAEESAGTYIQYDVIDMLDSVQLKPAKYFEILRPLLYLTLPSFAVTIVTYFYMNSVIVYIAFAGSLVFVATGIMFSVTIAITRISSDRNTYIFTKDGLRIQSRKNEEKRIMWEEIKDIELIGKGEGNRIKRVCIVKTNDQNVVIQLNKFSETTEDTANPDAMIDIISLYYEDKKKN